MTADQFPTSRSGQVIELSKVVSAGLVLLTALGVAFGWITWGRDKWAEIDARSARLDAALAAVEELPALREEVARVAAGVAGLRDEVTLLRSDVSVLQLPETIFQVSVAGSGPIDGYCLAGQDCTFELLMRRSPSAIACRVLVAEPDQPRQFLLQLGTAGEERREVLRVDDGAIVNLGVDWTPVSVTLRMPSDFGVIDRMGEAPAAALVMQRSYDRCTGPGDRTVATRASNPLPVSILAAPPAPPAGSPALTFDRP